MNCRAPAAGEVVCFLMSEAEAPAEPERFLTPGELQRAQRFHAMVHRERWAGWRSGLRLLLGSMLACHPREVPVTDGPHGKPVLAGSAATLHFNLSHCDDFAIYAFCASGPVGVDIEHRDRGPDLLQCASAFCHPEELAAAARMPAPQRPGFLLDCWVAKEALLKALGTGLTHPPHDVLLEWSMAAGTARPSVALPGAHPLLARKLNHGSLSRHVAVVAATAAAPATRVLESTFLTTTRARG